MRKIIILVSITILLFSCTSKEKGSSKLGFIEVSPLESGVNFQNTIIENDTLNYFNYPFLYLGAGVSTGDINNDGLPDLYFTGNLIPNKLYLNKGNLQFEDITEAAGVSGDNRWYSGTTMVDINNDGFLDIYLSVSGKSGNTSNQLFINNGNNTFSEQAESYGIADKGTSIQSTFFDYNNDGLLDLFVANYPTVKVSMGNMYYKALMEENNHLNSGHLYKNNGNQTFTDVTAEAGVQNFGLTLGLIASDFNNDGFTDLYLSNDFNVPDYFYKNNGNGTFTEISNKATRHTSMFGMGMDAADFNNDGLTDIVQVDMTAEDYKRSKTNMASMSPETFFEAIDLGFNYQYMQNSLQLNNGEYQGIPVFSEISRFSGLATTDWSWGALFADFDNDGLKDVFITNGVKRDVNNNDAIVKNQSKTMFGESQKLDFNLLPSTPIANYAYKNNGDLTFSKVTADWGLDKEGFSNGFVYSDLDNDGDLDLVINNMDGEASVYENEAEKTAKNYLKIKLKGQPNNTFGLGAKVFIKTEEGAQNQELTLTRGYQSSVEPIIHFGVGNSTKIKEIEIIWAGGNKQILKDVSTNQLLEIQFQQQENNVVTDAKTAFKFEDITANIGLNFSHTENSYNDFYYEPLLPHKYSQLGPAITVGDVNGDGLDDFFVGNAAGSSGALYVQNQSGKFTLSNGPWEDDSQFEDTGCLFFDADNDGDLDLYVVNGGNDITKPDSFYQDRFYINTNIGFVKSINSLPKIDASGKTITAGDYDGDGDLDLFVGGRIVPGKYPYAAKSYILRNNGGKDNTVKFEDITKEMVPELLNAGLVTSALWDDFDADGKLDLIVTGEWMPLRFFKNIGKKFEEKTEKYELNNSIGWWYSLQKLDVDLDGDMDYIAGNLGLNYKYRTTEKSSFEVYANDFDENGKSDIVLGYDKQGKKLPLRGRECSSQQVPAIKQRFETYESYANAELEDIYGKKMLQESLHYKANTFAHHWLENKGNGEFKLHKLPNQSQLSSMNVIKVIDYNKDSFPDLLMGGNLYGSEVETPRNDAGLGLVLKGSSKGFEVVKANETGLFIEGEIKDIIPIKLVNRTGESFIIAVNNKPIKVISIK